MADRDVPHASYSGIIGRRISIRLREGSGFRDILGILRSATCVEKRDGSIEEFDPERVFAWRIVEEGPSRAGRGAPYSERVRELEKIASRTWPADEEISMGGWVLRATQGTDGLAITRRANSVIPLGAPPFGDPQISLDEALAHVKHFYGSRRLSPLIQVPLPTYQQLDEKLEELGWSIELDAQMLVADKSDIIRSAPVDVSSRIHRSDECDLSWISLQNDGSDLIMKKFPAEYFSIRDGHSAVIARGRLAHSDGWAMISALYVHSDHRSQGYGREILGAMARHSPSSKLALQVNSGNKAALALYTSLGFRSHHHFRFRLCKGN
jgi:N-acetylglutamate synthase